MADIFNIISGGFFDSVSSDRLYSAEDMNMPYKRMFNEGIFKAGGAFQLSAPGGMTVAVATGNALIGDKWGENPEPLNITIAGNTASGARIDSIILRMDGRIETRAVGITYRQGEPTDTATPTAADAPALINTGSIRELRLADIVVRPNVTELTEADIWDQRGGTQCPWVTIAVDGGGTSQKEISKESISVTFDESGSAALGSMSAYAVTVLSVSPAAPFDSAPAIFAPYAATGGDWYVSGKNLDGTPVTGSRSLNIRYVSEAEEE